ncbi:hypothetical protein P167DRAFT_194281 [Morchella conica CCBAS932]|uniref:Uncharacterized protein n=1 Tax=Morchella conica CCBAS932 TaxID=1392247 RepID=A0A3N4L5S6_9PEZI|nr:hypothetical protein P167DRAFT_194281 [Morchella conica CCBAS932]
MVYQARRRTFLHFYFFFILPFRPWPFISSLWFFYIKLTETRFLSALLYLIFLFLLYGRDQKALLAGGRESYFGVLSFLVSVCLKLSSPFLLSQVPLIHCIYISLTTYLVLYISDMNENEVKKPIY